MPEKDQIIITIDSEVKQKFRIACIEDRKSMTDTLSELITEYLKNRK